MKVDTNQVLGRNQLFSEMQAGRPYKSYKKAILGQVSVVIWDNFQDAPVEIILKGSPARNEEGTIVDVWSDKEDVFFNRVNAKLLKKGLLLPYKRPEAPAPVEKTIEQSTDEELVAIVNLKFLALQAKLNKIDSSVVLFRLLDIARENEKSEKIIKAIEARISEIQVSELQPKRVEGAEVEE